MTNMMTPIISTPCLTGFLAIMGWQIPSPFQANLDYFPAHFKDIVLNLKITGKNWKPLITWNQVCDHRLKQKSRTFSSLSSHFCRIPFLFKANQQLAISDFSQLCRQALPSGKNDQAHFIHFLGWEAY